ncbi:MAG: radical SAM protein [Bdellovibrionaceae bacterium]|nr:radical SAM protein [Pseudobdellovibrionaceae bacterium]
MLDLGRYKNLTAFNAAVFTAGGPDTFIGFQSDTLEVAHLTRDVFESLAKVSLKSVLEPQTLLSTAVRENIQELNEWSQQSTLAPLEKKAKTSFKAKSLNINVTQICNLKCTYCAAGGDGTYGDPVKRIEVEKTLPQLKYFLAKLDEGERFHISFLGGEPLLFPSGVRAICEYVSGQANEKGFVPSYKITTNGTIMNDEIMDLLTTYKPTMVISMDGKPEIIDRFRPQKNNKPTSRAIEKTLETLNERRLEIGPLAVHAVFTAQHTAVRETYEYFRAFNFDWIDFIYSVSDENEEANAQYMNEVAKTAERAWLLGGEQELRKIYLFDNYFDRLDSQERLENHCGLGKSFAVIDSRNQIFNCPWTVGQAENRLGQGQWMDEAKLADYDETVIERNRCQPCWAKYMCGGGCSFVHQTTSKSDTLKKSLQFCERTRFLTALSIYYYAKARVESDL